MLHKKDLFINFSEFLVWKKKVLSILQLPVEKKIDFSLNIQVVSIKNANVYEFLTFFN